MTKTIPQKLLQSIKYENGNLYWTIPARGRQLNKPVGSKNKAGYLGFSFEGSHYYCHRVVYELHNGPIGNLDIDHIDRNRANNSIENLRVVDRSTNRLNNNASNITKNKRWGTYRVQVYKEGVCHSKSFKTYEEALMYKEEFKTRLQNVDEEEENVPVH